MNEDAIIKTHKTICRLVASGKIFNALGYLQQYADQSGSGELAESTRQQADTYRNILSYTVKGVNDPLRSRIYNRLAVSLFSIADSAREVLLAKLPLRRTSRKYEALRQRESLRAELHSMLGELNMDEELAMLLNKSHRNGTYDDESIAALTEKYFELVWNSDRLDDTDVELLHEFVSCQRLLPQLRSTLVTALFFSLWRCYDTRKFLLLRDFYYDSELQVSRRALTGMMLCLYYYDDRIKFYPDVSEMLMQLNESGALSAEETTAMMKQLVRALDTARITQKLNEEIIPGIRKIGPELEEKLGLKDILNDDPGGDFNPDWEKVLGESPDLLGKIEELSRMQLEGSDVFMSAFSQLKHFSFFEKLPHWFLPFSKDHPALDNAFRDEEEGFRDVFGSALERSSYMCNSDKYSFCLNLDMLPEAQKKMLLAMFNAELSQMDEISGEDEMLDATFRNRKTDTQYIQDLYRFFKLHPLAIDTEDPFSLELDLYNKSFIGILFPGNELKLVMADFLFTSDHFSEALKVYRTLIEESKPGRELFQRAGYCCQKMGDYSAALEYYMKSEIIDVTDVWTIKRIAHCYHMTGNIRRAADYYKQASTLEPANMNNYIKLANCYLHLKDFKQALHYYYKVEFESTAGAGIARPIAWCLFVLGKFSEAEAKLSAIVETDTAGKYDLMNYGHLMWVTGRAEEAVHYYLSSIRRDDNSFEDFLKGFEDDAVYLTAHGIPPEEIPLMADFLKFELSK